MCLLVCSVGELNKICGTVKRALSNKKFHGYWSFRDLVVEWLLGRLKAWLMDDDDDDDDELINLRLR